MLNDDIKNNFYKEIEIKYDVIKDAIRYQFVSKYDVNDERLYDYHIAIKSNIAEKLALRVSKLQNKSYQIVSNFMDLTFSYTNKKQFYSLVDMLLLVYKHSVGHILREGNYKIVALLTDEEKDNRLLNTLSILQNLSDKEFLKKFAFLSEFEGFEELLLNENVLLKEILNYKKSLDYKKKNSSKKSTKYRDIIDMLYAKTK